MDLTTRYDIDSEKRRIDILYALLMVIVYIDLCEPYFAHEPEVAVGSNSRFLTVLIAVKKTAQFYPCKSGLLDLTGRSCVLNCSNCRLQVRRRVDARA